MPKKFSALLFVFLLLSAFYLLMKITNMKIDFSSAGIRSEHTGEYTQCINEYQENHPRLNQSVASFDEYSEMFHYCDSIIPKKEQSKKVFHLPKIYFLPPSK